MFVSDLGETVAECSQIMSHIQTKKKSQNKMKNRDNLWIHLVAAQGSEAHLHCEVWEDLKAKLSQDLGTIPN